MSSKDVTIPVELEVYCTKRSPTDFHRVKSVKLNGFEIFSELCDGDLIHHKDRDELLDKWCMTNEETVKTIEHDIEFECTFNDIGRLVNVELGYESINDIIADGMYIQLTDQALSNHIADLKDRGIKYRRGA